MLCFGHVPAAPGDRLRAVIVPMFPDEVAGWRDLVAGDALVMYEGTRIYGRATVVWATEIGNTAPPRGTPVMGNRISDDHLTRFESWARGGPAPVS